MRHPAKEQENLCHHSTKIVNKKQSRVDEFVNSPLPRKILSNWFSKYLPQISCASFSSALKFPPSFISFLKFQIVFYHWTLILFPQLPPTLSLKEVRDKMILGYAGRQRKGCQELSKRERGWEGKAEGGKHIFWPVFVLRECLKVSSEGILQMLSGTLGLIHEDKEQGGNWMSERQKGSGRWQKFYMFSQKDLYGAL